MVARSVGLSAEGARDAILQMVRERRGSATPDTVNAEAQALIQEAAGLAKTADALAQRARELSEQAAALLRKAASLAREIEKE